MFCLRPLLEGEVVRPARSHMTADFLVELERTIAKMEAWDGDLLGSAALDLQFHRALLDTVTGKSSEDPQTVLRTHVRLSLTEPERHSELPKKPS